MVSFFIVCCIVCCVFLRKISRESYRIISVIIISGIGYFWNNYIGFRLPMFSDTGLTAVIFVYLGTYVKDVLKWRNRRFEDLLLGVVALVMGITFCMHCSMQNNSYPFNMVGFVSTSTISTMAVILISKAICKNRILQYIGENSLIILCFHMFLVMAITFVVKKFQMSPLPSFLLSFITSSLLSIAIVPVIKKCFPFVFCLKNKKDVSEIML